MQCPEDQTVLQMTERQGVEIDYCPTCRGVWLNRGELDKILDRAAAERPAPSPNPEARPYQPPPAPDPRTESAGYPVAPYAQYEPSPQHNQYPQYPRSPDSPDERYGGRGYDQRGYDQRGGKRRRKDSFLGDLFDF